MADMTVKELVEQLIKYPLHAKVLISSYEEGFCTFRIEYGNVSYNDENKEYEGPYFYEEDGDIPVVMLTRWVHG